MISVTCSAPVNIALIKYWGKRDQDLNLPLNGSISVTLHQDQLSTVTTVYADSAFKEDRIWLNGQEKPLNDRILKVLREVRKRVSQRTNGDKTDLSEHTCVHIKSSNNFPTAAGLASSASGYSCIAFALMKLFSLEGEFSDVARLGSGSASRSMYGGFVEWLMGRAPDGSDSISRQLSPHDHWPQMRILIALVSEKEKLVPSTEGMGRSAETSSLLRHRVETIVPQRLAAIREAISERDFQRLALVTMQESNQLHAICQDSYPPIQYLSGVSHDLIRFCHEFNCLCGSYKVAYTFDAGPNACLFILEDTLSRFVSLLLHFFPPSSHMSSFISGLNVLIEPNIESDISAFSLDTTTDALHKIIITKPGPGPRVKHDVK